MKHFYLRTVMLLTLLTFCLGTWAQTVYTAVGFSEGNYLKDITPGQKICLQSAKASSICVLDTALTENLKTSITDGGVWEFRVANESTGQYNLYNPASKKYLAVGSDANGYAVLLMTASQRNAEAFYVRKSVNYNEASEVPDDADWAAVCFEGMDGALIFTFADWGAPSKTTHYQLLGYSGSVAGFTGQSKNTCWYAFPVEESKGLDKLSSVFNQYFPSGNNDEFIRGNEPGNVPADKFDALQEVFERSQQLINETSSDVDACNKACVDIEKAYKDAKAAIIPFQAGYFYIVDHVGPASGMFESNGTLHFNKGAWTQPEHPAAKDMAYIWKLVPKDETPNLFYLQNFVTGNYAGFVNGYSTVIPTTSEKTQAYMISNFPGVKGYFGIQVNGSEMYLHANTSGANTVVYWDTSHQNSAWKLHAIPQADIDALQTELQQQKNNKQFSNLFEEADAYYKKGLAYKSDATPGDYPATVDGLLTHVQQLSTNAQEPTEGKIGNLIDGNLKTYFHTTWSVANPDVEYHCLNVDLEKAVSAVTMKYAKRFNSHSNGLPSKVHIFTSNDSVNWVSQGIVKFAFTDSATIDGSKVANFIGRTSAAFKNGEKYRYLRLQVEQNQGGSRTNGNLYFFLGELRIYEAAYDKDNSLAESVDPTIRKNLVDQLEAAPAVIAAGNATQDNINALQTALEAYKAVYPDPATLQAEIQRQQQLIDVAVEGEGFGNYDNGAKASFQAALDAVKNHINEFRTIEQLNTAKAQVAEAAKTFAAALHKPATGDIIYLRCKSDNATLNKQYVYAAANNTKITLRWGWYSADDGEDANLSNLLTLMWMVKANDDGTFTLKNVGTGLNMAARTEKATNTDNDLRLAAAGSETPVSVSFEAAPVASSFLLSVGKGTYLRFYTKAGLVYTDNAPSADSYFTIEKAVAWGENTYVGFTAQRPTPCTLPYDIESSIGDEGTLYQVKGLYTEGDKKTLELTAFAPNTIISAGTPFIVVANEGHDGVNFFPTASSLYEFTYSFDCAKVNGLCGTLDRQEMKAGQGIFNKGKVVSATNEDAIGGNSAYLDHTVPVITEKGDYSVPVEGFDVTGISPSVTVTAHDAIYDLQGRRVVKTQRGLYIINGKKVVVK